jgi:hypothetical protein
MIVRCRQSLWTSVSAPGAWSIIGLWFLCLDCSVDTTQVSWQTSRFARRLKDNFPRQGLHCIISHYITSHHITIKSHYIVPHHIESHTLNTCSCSQFKSSYLDYVYSLQTDGLIDWSIDLLIGWLIAHSLWASLLIIAQISRQELSNMSMRYVYAM